VILGVDDVSIALDGRPLLEHVSFNAEAGDRIGIVGRSGSGKTTLLRVIAGVLPLTCGRLSLSPEDSRVALVPQEPVLLAALTVAENLEVFLRAANVGRADRPPAVEAVVEQFALGDLLPKLAMELSGGEQQRVALARVAALRPAVLVADEPTARQDHDTRLLVISALVEAAADGVLVVATHDPDMIATCSTTIEVESRP
jgi:ABC-type lipoprotein export system ATPase subunit